MRRFLTIGIKSTGRIDILSTANATKAEHIDEFNQHAAAKKKKSAPYAEVQVIDLSKIVKRKRFGSVKGGGKRTVAVTVKKRKKSAKKPARSPRQRDTTQKRTVARTVKSKSKKKAAKPSVKKSRAKSKSRHGDKSATRKPATSRAARKSPAPTGKSDGAGSSETPAPKLPGASEAK